MDIGEKIFDAFKRRMMNLNEKDRKSAWSRIFFVLLEVEQESNIKTMEELGLEVPDVKPSVTPESPPIIIGSRTHRKKMQTLEISDVLRDTLNSVISLGGRASADDVSKITNRKTNLESSYLKELWAKGLLLTRQRDGRIVFYSTPERALVDTMKEHGKLTTEQLVTVLSEYAYDHRLEKDTMLSIIKSAEAKNLVRLEGDVVSLV